MNLSEHFTLKEATKSSTADRLGIENDPPVDVIDRMKLVAKNILEPVRAHFGKPVTINSFYRCPELNKAIGSKPNSQHVTGEAVDFEVPGISNDDVALWVRDNLTFDQCIREFGKPGIPDSGWVHVSYKETGCRKECLTVTANGTFPGILLAPDAA